MSHIIEVTPRAAQLVARHFKNHTRKPIRIFVKVGGCGMRSLGVALEAATEADEVFEIEGTTYVVDRKLLKKIQPITVDADGVSFRLSGRELYPPTGCGSCAYMCGARGGRRCSGVCATCENPCAEGMRRMARRRRQQAVAA